jgi:8-oxoguanine deaminase
MPTLLAKNAEVLVTMDSQRRELKNAGLYVDIGSLEPGKCADFFSLDLHTIGYAGALHDPVAATLFCAPQSAKFTVINGKVIVRDSEVVTMDMKPVIETHNRCASEMANALEI